MSKKNVRDDCFISWSTKVICIELEDPSKLHCITLIMIANFFYYDNEGISDSTVTCVNAFLMTKKILIISAFILIIILRKIE